MTKNQASCELCTAPGGEVIYQHEKYRVVLVDDAGYPGFCRIIWNDHVKEMTDLPSSDRTFFMHMVWRIEEAVRRVMQPHKINLASLGNVVPHLHWHIIPRFEDDAHFPNPIWGEAKREPEAAVLAQRAGLVPALRAAIIDTLEQSIF